MVIEEDIYFLLLVYLVRAAVPCCVAQVYMSPLGGVILVLLTIYGLYFQLGPIGFQRQKFNCNSSKMGGFLCGYWLGVRFTELRNNLRQTGTKVAPGNSETGIGARMLSKLHVSFSFLSADQLSP